MTPLVLDLETFYSKDFSLSKISIEEYVRSPLFQIIGVGLKIPGKPSVWHSDSTKYIRQFLLDMVKWDDAYMIAHNTPFDAFILENILGIQAKMYADTLAMARPKHGVEVGASLAKLAKFYNIGEKGTEVVNALGKRRKDFTPEELRAYGEYCKNDCILTGKLFNLLKGDFTPLELRVLDVTTKMAVRPVLTLNVPLLESALTTLQNKQHQELLDLAHSLGEDTDDPDVAVAAVKTRLSSNPKFAAFLTEHGVEVPMKPSPSDETGQKMTFAFAKTDEGMIALQEHDDPLVAAAAVARLGVKSTIRETRMQTMIGVGKRGTLPFPLRYAGAHTNRWSGDWGWNLQNLTKHRSKTDREALRDAIEAPEGYMVIASDSSQIEARVNAWFWGQQDVVDLFKRGGDPYCAFGTVAYGREITKADTVERFVSKGCVLGLGFGMGAPKLKVTLKKPVNGVFVDIELEECERLVKLYRTMNSNITAGWRTSTQAIEAMHQGSVFRFGIGTEIQAEEGLLRLPSNNILYYPGLRFEMHEGRKQASYIDREGRKRKRLYGAKLVENVVQSMARDIIAWQMIQLEDMGWRSVGTVHDELIFIAPEDRADECQRDVEQVMKLTPPWASGCPISCESAVARSYGDC